MGITAAGDPQFTIGAKYSALSNLDVSLDYVINNLAVELDENDDFQPTSYVSFASQFE